MGCGQQIAEHNGLYLNMTGSCRTLQAAAGHYGQYRYYMGSTPCHGAYSCLYYDSLHSTLLNGIHVYSMIVSKGTLKGIHVYTMIVSIATSQGHPCLYYGSPRACMFILSIHSNLSMGIHVYTMIVSKGTLEGIHVYTMIVSIATSRRASMFLLGVSMETSKGMYIYSMIVSIATSQWASMCIL